MEPIENKICSKCGKTFDSNSFANIIISAFVEKVDNFPLKGDLCEDCLADIWDNREED